MKYSRAVEIGGMARQEISHHVTQIVLLMSFNILLGSTSHTYAQAAMLPTSGQYGGYPSPSYHSGVPYPGHGCSDPYSQSHTHSHHHYPQPPSTRPQCGANGCTNLVHWEPDVGSFDYCTPECRNKHLLPIYKDQLLSDLEELTDQLHTDAVADASDEYKTASAG